MTQLRHASGPSTPRDGAYWDDVARRFARRRHYLDEFLGALKRDAYLELVDRWGAIAPERHLLKTDLFEEAHGPDALAPALIRRGAAVYAMDVSPALAAQAQQSTGRAAMRVLACDARRLALADATMDLVISPSTLDHFTDPADLRRSLLEIRRILRPGGRLIISLDNRQNITDCLLRLAKRLGLVPYYLGRSYRIGELTAELRTAGFDVADTAAILHNPRLLAVALVSTAKALRLKIFTRAAQAVLLWMRRFGQTRWRFYTGSFIAALAIKPAAPVEESRP